MHFCFVTPNGRSCKCQDGWTLNSDQKSCHGTLFNSLILCLVLFYVYSVALSPGMQFQ